MSFAKKTWKNRVVEYPNRRTINDGYTTKVVTVGRDEGVVAEEGDPINATTLNDLENRINAAIEGGGGGGGGGTFDYEDLYNRPSINSVELVGNRTTSELNIDYNDLQNKPVIPDISTVVDLLYPVGTIYISVSSTNPGLTMGGTWVSFGAGKTLVGVDSGDADFNASNKTGGEKTHTLTVAEMPSHRHDTLPSYGSNNLTTNTNNHGKMMGAASSAGWATNAVNDDATYHPIKLTGGDTAHNNMQPYITTYFWKRVA